MIARQGSRRSGSSSRSGAAGANVRRNIG